MKIFCIGRNYSEHAKELNNAVPTKPLVFMKPPTAVLTDNRPFYHPEFSKDIHYEGEIVLRISKKGKYVQPEFAREYFDQIAFGIDFTARDLQDELKQKGHPWEIAKGFDGSAVLSPFVAIGDWDTTNIDFEMHLNGQVVQSASTSELIFPFETLICYISQFFTLQVGDIIYTGTPAGVGSIKIGDKLEGFIKGKQMLTCEIK